MCMQLENMKNNLSELRTELIGKKAVYEQQCANAKRTLEELKTSLESIKPDDIEFLKNHGFNAEILNSINLTRLSSDAEYLEGIKAELCALAQGLYDTLMKEV